MQELESINAPQPNIIVEVSSIEDEVDRVMFYVNNIDNALKKKINIVIPKGLDIKHKSNLHDAERITRGEYDTNFYNDGLKNMQKALPKINEAIGELAQFQKSWGFDLGNNYKIVLTRYGTGGSYNDKTNKIVVRTSKLGEYARKNADATPIHEITHICLEHLATQWRLTYSQREKLVNTICSILFPQVFQTNTEGLAEHHFTSEQLKDVATVFKIAKANN